VTISMVIIGYFLLLLMQEIGQTSNAVVTENNPCHDHLNMASGEVN